MYINISIMYYATQIKHVFGNCHWYSYTLSNIKWTGDSSVFCSLPASIEQQRMSISDISRLDWKRHIQMNNSLDLIQFLQHTNWTISGYLKIHESLCKFRETGSLPNTLVFTFILLNMETLSVFFATLVLLFCIRVGVLLSLCFYEQVTPV